MSRQITFDWQTDEDEYLRQFVQHSHSASDDAHSDAERKLALIAFRSLVALIVLIVASGSASLTPMQIDRRETERELNIVLEVDETAWRARDREGHAAPIDPRVDREWLSEWRENWGTSSETGRTYDLTLGPTRRINDELVQAEVSVTMPRPTRWQPVLSRETRFYRNVDGLWLRTVPPTNFWGKPRTPHSSYFSFQYYAPGEQSVRTSADLLETAYANLYRTLGWGPVPEQERFVVDVQSGLVRTRGWGDGDIELSSLILVQIPIGTSETAYLADRVFWRVSARMMRERVPYGAIHGWAFKFTVMRGWLSSELLGQPSPWRAEGDRIFRVHTRQLLPLELTDIDEYYVGGVLGRDTVLRRFAATSTVLDYVVSQHGRPVLAELLDGFSDYGSWAGLIESVFEMSEEEFEISWNEFLTTEYGF